MAVLLTPPVLQFFDDNGDPLANGKLYTYIAGTTTPKQTFTDATGLVAAPNPIILDAAGRAVVWIAGSYKFVLTDALDNIIRTTDNVTAFNITPAASPSYFQSFSGTGAQVSFTLSTDLGTDENSVMVFVNNGGDNSITNTPTFESLTAIAAQTVYNLAIPVGTNTSAIQVFVNTTTKGYEIIKPADFTLTGTGGNILTLTTAPSVVGANSVLVFHNPVLSGDQRGLEIQNPNSYTLNGTNLTFAVAPAVGTNNIYVFAPSLLLGAASAAAAQAQASADAAAISATLANAASLAGTSTTSVTVGTGSKNFTTQANKNFNLGAWLVVASAANVATYMFGQITAYNSVTGALTINVPTGNNTTGNSGSTAADWILNIAGVQGVQGASGSGTANMINQSYVSGVGFTPGVTTTLTLTNTPIAASASALFVVFDDSIQQPSEWAYNVGTGAITFNSAIPVGIGRVYCFWFTDIAVGTPTNGTVTFPKFDASVPVTSTTLTGASNTNIPTTLAAKTYIDNSIAATKVLATQQSTTSGTTKYFTGIPANCKRITVMFNGVSLSGTDQVIIQLGTAAAGGTIETTGYAGSTSQLNASVVSIAVTNGFGIYTSSAANTVFGAITITLLDQASNTWVATGVTNLGGTPGSLTMGQKALAATLDRIRITSSVSNTFDAGGVNIMYEA